MGSMGAAGLAMFSIKMLWLMAVGVAFLFAVSFGFDRIYSIFWFGRV